MRAFKVSIMLCPHKSYACQLVRISEQKNPEAVPVTVTATPPITGNNKEEEIPAQNGVFILRWKKICTIRFQYVMLNLIFVFPSPMDLLWEYKCRRIIRPVRREQSIGSATWLTLPVKVCMSKIQAKSNKPIARCTKYINYGNKKSYHFICPRAHAQQQQHHWFSTSEITLR